MNPLRTKTASNRKNALKSTGPKSESGKQAVALNSVTHGLRSAKPVLPWVETESEWIAHRDRLISQMEPVGALETAFSERVALGFWRLARCVDAESRILGAVREKRRWRAIGNTLVVEHRKMSGESPEAVFSRLLAERDQQRAVADLWHVIRKPGREKPNPGVVNWLVDSICSADSWAKLGNDFNDTFDWPPPRMTDLRAMVDWLLERLFAAPAEAFEVLVEGAMARASETRDLVARIEREADQATELALVESDSVEKMIRYESNFHRALQKDLHELQRLQALRKGQPVTAPIALDLTMDL